MTFKAMVMATAVLVAACSNGVSTEGVEITRVDEGTTTTEPESLALIDEPVATEAPATTVDEPVATEAPATTVDQPATTEASEGEDVDIPSDEQLIEAVSLDGMNLLDITAAELQSTYSTQCPQDIEELTSGLIFFKVIFETAGIEFVTKRVDSIDYQGDGSEAVVSSSFVDQAGVLVEVEGFTTPESETWIVEDAQWKLLDSSCG